MSIWKRATFILCLLLMGLPHAADAAQHTGVDDPLNQTRTVGGMWDHKPGGALNGTTGETERAFALPEAFRYASAQSAEVLITPEKHEGASWSAAGLCLWLNSADYWRLALVESPDGRTRYAELQVQNNGVGIGEQGLRVLDRTAGSLAWKWGAAYRLRLVLSQSEITGEVVTPQGQSLWHIRYALADAALVHFLKPGLGVQGMQAAFSNASQTLQASVNAAPVTCATLKQPASHGAWLSLPVSRLVVNPTMPMRSDVPPGFSSSLPVDLAYYAGETPIRLPAFWAWRPGYTGAVHDAITRGPAAAFSRDDASKWRASRASADFRGQEVRLQVEDRPFGSMTTEVTVDLDRTPFLAVRVPHTDGGWALKVNSGGAAVDTYIQHDINQAGAAVYDIPHITGWHGKRSFRVILFALGAAGDITAFDTLRFVGANGAVPAIPAAAIAWFPHEIVTTGDSVDHTLRTESDIFMPDESTVAQRVRVAQGTAQTFVLTGSLPPGATASWDAEHNAVLISGAHFAAALHVSRTARWLGGFASAIDFLAGAVPASNQTQSGVWALALDGVKAADDLVVIARFAPGNAGAETLVADAAAAGSAAGYEVALRAREADWNRRLATLPEPLTFSLASIDPKGATPEQIRAAYYRAWIFLLANILPPMPENKYPFPQAPCGKPSLWGEGAPRCRATSQWESCIAMQILAQVEPRTAWAAYEGLMSVVQASGAIEGEGLPSRHAQTAWMLYEAAGDRDRLAGVYPAMKRLLLWKAADPRWLYKDATPTDQKDSEFVVHALMDMLYAQRIAMALAMPGEERFWQTQIDRLAADYHRWFWEAGEHKTYRIYRAATHTHEGENGSWCLQALTLPPAILHESERDMLLGLFRGMARPDEIPFLVPALAGFPKYNYTLRGIWQYGTPREAAQMAESAMRDVTLAGEFSENYNQSFPPTVNGVIPSVFGAAQIIDGVLWRNGVPPLDSLLTVATIPGGNGVRNYRVRGEPVDIVLDVPAGIVEMQGVGLIHLQRPATALPVPAATGDPHWRIERLSPGRSLSFSAIAGG